jgi:hypothetical protein
LHRNSRYRDSIEIDVGARDRAHREGKERYVAARFVTNVRPSRWMMGTEMTIAIRPSLSQHGRTHVVADTKSQWFVLGDIEGHYAEHLRVFMAELRAELQTAGGSTQNDHAAEAHHMWATK